MSIACMLAVPSMLAFIPLTLGVPLAWAVGAALVGLGLTIYAMVKAARWRSGTAAQTADRSPAVR
ncbi:MAG TPA: hypothetical protein VHN18_09545 [Micromonosporaceae bacterium]|nr:hypothetical protein [Micromonosporaceae bacterium]